MQDFHRLSCGSLRAETTSSSDGEEADDDMKHPQTHSPLVLAAMYGLMPATKFQKLADLLRALHLGLPYTRCTLSSSSEPSEVASLRCSEVPLMWALHTLEHVTTAMSYTRGLRASDDHGGAQTSYGALSELSRSLSADIFRDVVQPKVADLLSFFGSDEVMVGAGPMLSFVEGETRALERAAAIEGVVTSMIAEWTTCPTREDIDSRRASSERALQVYRRTSRSHVAGSNRRHEPLPPLESFFPQLRVFTLADTLNLNRVEMASSSTSAHNRSGSNRRSFSNSALLSSSCPSEQRSPLPSLMSLAERRLKEIVFPIAVPQMDANAGDARTGGIFGVGGARGGEMVGVSSDHLTFSSRLWSNSAVLLLPLVRYDEVQHALIHHPAVRRFRDTFLISSRCSDDDAFEASQLMKLRIATALLLPNNIPPPSARLVYDPQLVSRGELSEGVASESGHDSACLRSVRAAEHRGAVFEAASLSRPLVGIDFMRNFNNDEYGSANSRVDADAFQSHLHPHDMPGRSNLPQRYPKISRDPLLHGTASAKVTTKIPAPSPCLGSKRSREDDVDCTDCHISTPAATAPSAEAAVDAPQATPLCESRQRMLYTRSILHPNKTNQQTHTSTLAPSMGSLQRLPAQLLQFIFLHLVPSALDSSLLVCKRWGRLMCFPLPNVAHPNFLPGRHRNLTSQAQGFLMQQLMYCRCVSQQLDKFARDSWGERYLWMGSSMCAATTEVRRPVDFVSHVDREITALSAMVTTGQPAQGAVEEEAPRPPQGSTRPPLLPFDPALAALTFTVATSLTNRGLAELPGGSLSSRRFPSLGRLQSLFPPTIPRAVFGPPLWVGDAAAFQAGRDATLSQLAVILRQASSTTNREHLEKVISNARDDLVHLFSSGPTPPPM